MIHPLPPPIVELVTRNVPTRQVVVLTATAGGNAATADSDAAVGDFEAEQAADVALGAVEPVAADDTAQGAVKPSAADDIDGLCHRVCRDHCRHGLRDPLGPRRRAPGHCLAA